MIFSLTLHLAHASRLSLATLPQHSCEQLGHQLTCLVRKVLPSRSTRRRLLEDQLALFVRLRSVPLLGHRSPPKMVRGDPLSHLGDAYSSSRQADGAAHAAPATKRTAAARSASVDIEHRRTSTSEPRGCRDDRRHRLCIGAQSARRPWRRARRRLGRAAGARGSAPVERRSCDHYGLGLYNQQRRHSSIGYVAPAEFERRYHDEQSRVAA